MSEEKQPCEKAGTSGNPDEDPGSVCGIQETLTRVELNNEPTVKVLFWNVNSLKKRFEVDRVLFENHIAQFDVICLTETWVRQPDWPTRMVELESIGEYTWSPMHAMGNEQTGIGGGGIVMGIKADIQIVGTGGQIHPNAMKQTIQIGKSTWDIVTVYIQILENSENTIPQIITKVFDSIKKECGNHNVLVGGDFNARTGTLQSACGPNRKTEDSGTRRLCNTLIKKLTEQGFGIMNGCTKGDEEGRITCTHANQGTVIDYGIVRETSRPKISKFSVEQFGSSDHKPLVVEIKRE